MYCSYSDPTALSPAQASRLLKSGQGWVCIDLRPASEHRKEAIPGSISIPGGDTGNILRRFPDRATPLMLYCRSGYLSGSVLRRLQHAGFRQVYEISGGYTAWRLFERLS